MTHNVITLPEAEEHIYESAQWWAENYSAEEAARWFDEIWDAVHALGDRPQQWPLARENADFPCEIREFHFGVGSSTTHRIIFVIREEDVYILSVWHTSRADFQRTDTTFKG